MKQALDSHLTPENGKDKGNGSGELLCIRLEPTDSG